MPCPPTAAKCVNETWTYECRGNNQYLVPEGGRCGRVATKTVMYTHTETAVMEKNAEN
jgi:hypothetical protein